MRRALWSVAGLCIVAASGCGGAQAERPSDSSRTPAADYTVRRGEFVEPFLMTGQLEAVRSDSIIVPRNPSWNIQIRWMETDGVRVEEGQKVVELDNTALVSEADEKYLSVLDKIDERDQKQATFAAEEQDKVFQLEQKRVELAKAEIEASIPESIVERRAYQERQLALRRAQSEHDKAQEELEAFRKASASEMAVLEIALDKARREFEAAEQAIATLTLGAPRGGLLVVAENPWEDRKFQVGDTAWTGLTVARIPDLSEMRIESRLDDVDDGRVEIGDRATCTMDAYPELPIPCRIVDLTPIAQEGDRQSVRRAFRVSVTLDRTETALMRPGMSVKVEVLASSLADALLAPRGGLDLGVEPPIAHLAGGGRREVRVGPCNALECVVEDGLAEGDRLARFSESGRS
jgi:multidrug efflux pump subunit AcrA (membrane-fusion protein)